MKTALATLAFVVGGTMFAVSSQASTVATFADPAANGTTPLFTFNSLTNVLSGGWSSNNLTLQVPAQIPSGASYTNAHFTMTPVTVVGNAGPVLIMSPGQVNFFDSSANPLLTISFSGGFLQPTTNFGASDFVGFNVAFSGPVLNGYLPPNNEAFSFSFANLVNTHLDTGLPSGYTVTSSFTSSADLTTPAPGAAALLGLGGLVAARRRR